MFAHTKTTNRWAHFAEALRPITTVSIVLWQPKGMNWAAALRKADEVEETEKSFLGQESNRDRTSSSIHASDSS